MIHLSAVSAIHPWSLYIRGRYLEVLVNEGQKWNTLPLSFAAVTSKLTRQTTPT